MAASVIPDDYVRIGHRDSTAAFSRAVNALIRTGQLRFRFDRSRYSLPRSIGSVIPGLLQIERDGGKIIFNDRKLRLSSDLTPEALVSGPPLVVQETSYFAGLVTNELTGKRVSDGRTEVEIYDGFSLAFGNQKLLSLADSSCSNQIGVSTIAILRNGRLVFNLQTGKARQGSGLFVPSGSGSVDLEDWRRFGNSFVQDAMEREFWEECFSKKYDYYSVSQRCETRLLGYARLLDRGGKPEFFGVTLATMAADELGIRSSERDFIARNDHAGVSYTADALSQSLREFKHQNEARISISLFLCLQFLEDALASGDVGLVQWLTRSRVAS